MILRRPQLQGMGFGFDTLFASPQVQQAATQTAGNLLTTVGEGLVSLFGGDDKPAYTPPPPPPKPAIPTWVPFAIAGALGVALVMSRKG